MIEIKLTIQMAVICTLGIFALEYNYSIYERIPSQYWFYTEAAVTTFWLLYYGINPIIYLIFNK